MEPYVFDIGMYDGSDTAYYLRSGFRVVAVEANPAMIEAAERRFKQEIEAGRLTLVNAALSDIESSVEFHLAGTDPGSSTLYRERIAQKSPREAFSVRTVLLTSLFEVHGVPHYLKSDIEGADRCAVLPLSKACTPKFVSFEIGDDLELLAGHLASIGYRGFRIINQMSFNELAEVTSLRRRGATRLLRALGRYDEKYVWRRGHRFIRAHSSGPLPETKSRWYGYETMLRRWKEFCSTHPPDQRYGWYDLHATLIA